MADAPATGGAAATPNTAGASGAGGTATPAASAPTPAAPASPPQTTQATAQPSSPSSAAAASPSAEPAAKPVEPAAAAPDKSLIGNRDAKPADGAKPDDAAKPTEPAKPDEPIKYELKLPEGVTVDPAAMEAVTGILGEAKVAPEIAQKLADFHGNALKTALTDAGKAFLQKQTDVWNDTISGWQKEVMADKEFGGNNFPIKKGEIDQGLLTFFGAHNKPDDSPEMKAHDAFVETLKTGGAGSRLAMLRFVHKAVSRGSEGKPVQGNGPSAPRRNAAEVMYPPRQQAAE